MNYRNTFAEITKSQRALFNAYLKDKVTNKEIDEGINDYIFDTEHALFVPRQPLSLIFKTALNLKRTFGTRTAAGYLRNQAVSIETALYLLTRKGN
jgi:hypothetical protein